MQKIIPSIWFDHNAEEAANFYLSVFGGTLGEKTHYTEAGHDIHGMEAGTVLTINFELRGFSFLGLNGGPAFTLNPSVSFMVRCENAEKVDELWEKLSEGGKVLMPIDTYPFNERYCWVQDKYGVSWQVLVAEGPKIAPSLMFISNNTGKAEEAINFYTSVFKNSSVGKLARYGADQPVDEGNISYGDFMLEGQQFVAMDSGRMHDFNFNEAISLIVECKDQEEIDYFWDKLSADSKAEQCGWIKDKYGLSWQIVPEGMMEKMLNDIDQAKAGRAMAAMMDMKKIDIAGIQKAFDGE
ncbi:MAG: 3-demethylubiquinone-9 3-methyltransferase [Candidatus Nomurabacteria bacterium]|nr:3-demethylubiquinone-9 3-methyltransferase [Candidatus Nomurabacteria bacterium]